MKFVQTAALCAACVFTLSVGPAGAATFPTKLFLSSDGLALSSVPGRHVLSRTIQVDRTQGKALATWTASSDQDWLTVTPSGATGDSLTVKASAKHLAADQFYLANVTVTTEDGFSDTETLRVGLWVGSTAPGTVALDQSGTNIATNPVAPIAYIADGDSIQEYNVYTGAKVGTLKKVAPSVGYLEVSSDGGTLFAADTTHYKIIALDPNTGAVLGTYSVGFDNSFSFDIAYTRPYGQPALVVAGQWPDINGRIIAYPSGEQLATGIAPDLVAATPDGHTVFSVMSNSSPGTIYGYRVKLNHSALALESIGSLRLDASNCQDLAISHDGKHVYPACGAPYEFDVYSGKTLSQVQTLPASAYPNNIEIDSFDRAVGGINDAFNQYDVYVYNQKGNSLGNIPTYASGQQPGAMKVSGDGTRVINITDPFFQPQTLMIRNMP
jgi:hypothetical protein